MVKPDVDIVLMTEPGLELEGKNRLARIGFDRVVGYLAEPYQVMFTHRDDVEVASRLTTNAMGERMADVPELQIVDVRNPGEVADGMIPGAVNIPVGQLPDRTDELDPRRPTVVYCAGATARRWPRACCASAASPMSAMSWAATAPGSKPSRTPERQRGKGKMSTTAKHQVLIVGGGTAGITVAARMLRKGYTDVAVIEPSDKHYYQPLWTLVGGSQAKAASTERAESSVMPRASTGFARRSAHSIRTTTR